MEFYVHFNYGHTTFMINGDSKEFIKDMIKLKKLTITKTN